MCPKEKSKLLSITKRKPSSTARLENTNQMRTHSISCHDTNRPSEQATADWIAISRGFNFDIKSAQCPCHLWRGGPDTITLPTVLLTPSASKAADMAHLCVPQNQALRVFRGFVPLPDIQVCGTHGTEDLVNATITSNAEEEAPDWWLAILRVWFSFVPFRSDITKSDKLKVCHEPDLCTV